MVFTQQLIQPGNGKFVNFGQAKIQHILVAFFNRLAGGVAQNPFGVLLVQLAFFRNHFRLYPNTKDHAKAFNLVN